MCFKLLSCKDSLFTLSLKCGLSEQQLLFSYHTW